MADTNPTVVRSRPRGDARPLAPDGPPAIDPEEYREGFGEPLTETLNVENWRAGRDLGDEYRRIEAEVKLAVACETDLQRRVREEVHPRLAWGDGAPKGAGRYAVSVEEIAEVHRGLLFNGGAEACDGTRHVHDSLALTIYQIGISLVSYKGDQGTWCQRLFRRDLRLSSGDVVADALEVLDRRSRRGGLQHPSPRDRLSELGERAVMSYAERAVLLKKSNAVWKMGQGNPAPLELLTGAGSPDLAIESIKVIRDLVLGHQKFVFVASEPRARHLLTIGQGLMPLEYAIVGTLNEVLDRALENIQFGSRVTVDDTWDGRRLTPEQWVARFRDEVAPRVVVGTYRATLLAPAHLFYAHVDHADIAARVALADSVLQEQRGFPLLIDLADTVCRSVYGGSLNDLASAAYAAAGVPFRYQSERATREH